MIDNFLENIKSGINEYLGNTPYMLTKHRYSTDITDKGFIERFVVMTGNHGNYTDMLVIKSNKQKTEYDITAVIDDRKITEVIKFSDILMYNNSDDCKFQMQTLFNEYQLCFIKILEFIFSKLCTTINVLTTDEIYGRSHWTFKELVRSHE